MLRTAQRLAAFAAAVAVLCAPAMWNGFPLLFDDVGGYLERWPSGTLGNGRSAAYGLLLWLAAPSWWIPVVVLQAVATAWVIGRAVQVMGLDRSPWMAAGVVAAVAAGSGAALFVSQVMPDAWAAPAVLALLLLAWYADRLSALERVAMTAIIAFAGASHMATFGLLAGLSVLHTAAWAVRAKLGVAPVGLGRANLAAWSGLGLLLAANFLLAGAFTLTPGGKQFLFGRLVESGIVGQVLRQECPREDWALCGFRDALPNAAGDFLWDAESPLYKIGGWDDPRANAELASIMQRSLLLQPLDHVKSALTLTAAQFVMMGAPDSMGRVETWHNVWVMDAHAPWLTEPYQRSRQQRGDIALQDWSRFVVAPISLAGILAVPFGVAWTWRLGCRREAMFMAMVLLALLGNAVLCGVVSGAYARYQARLTWLAPFGVAVALAAARQRGARPLVSLAGAPAIHTV